MLHHTLRTRISDVKRIWTNEGSIIYRLMKKIPFLFWPHNVSCMVQYTTCTPLLVSTSKRGPCLCSKRDTHTHAFNCGQFDTLTCSYSPNCGQSVTWYHPMGDIPCTCQWGHSVHTWNCLFTVEWGLLSNFHQNQQRALNRSQNR